MPSGDGDNKGGGWPAGGTPKPVATPLSEDLELRDAGWVHLPDGGAPAAPACDIWFARVQDAGRFPLNLLSADERARCERYRFDTDRHRFLAGCAMTRLYLGDRLGVEAASIEIDRTCPRCGADHGKPHLPGSTWQYSISHSGDFVAVAFSEGTDVGLDIEVDSAPRSRDVWQAVLSPAELEVLDGVDFGERDHAFLRFWTRKEAALKATARGLTVEPRLLEVSAPAMAAAVTRWPAELAAVPLPSLCDLDFLPGHVAALARLGPLGAVRAVEVSPRPPKGATMGEA